MSKIKFTNNQVSIMRCANSLGHDGWSLNKLKEVKRKIKQSKRFSQDEACCYCLRHTDGEFSMVLDIEHIIPKSKRLKNMFTMRNLAISCKRCNMQIKQADTSFLTVPVGALPNSVFRSQYYRFIHPNLDNVDAHMRLIGAFVGRSKIIKYDILNNSKKAKYTYDYFKLKELEVDQANKAQGRKGRKKILDEKVAKAFSMLSH